MVWPNAPHSNDTFGYLTYLGMATALLALLI
jgi:hypothetical protein